ncbi:uncharacterized protein LOC133842884 [Drosophila sulfurigaster albostrigata]|uniref:uncharacterized protein LOC133842884 n=1 Tax=Drosophila sulfurigaster albostrigata TaxID=89887 RepID=UPI002D21A961|nr:uncharacterized protein LOC133842884 [Drosophila sulfurigaster albostrigata]
MSAIHIIGTFILLTLNSFVFGQTIDCQRPPKLVDPATCCRDGGRDQIAENCALQIMGANNGQQNNGPPSMDAATCLAECILTTSKYQQAPKQLNLAHIRNDLTMKFSNDSAFVEALTAAYAKCEPQSQRRLTAIQQMSPQQPKCSPFAAIVLGCAYMEYFKNCPTDRWTQSADCALAKTFVTQCGLGA